MTDKRFQANIITKTKVDPTSNLEEGAAPGVWSLSEAEKYTKAGVWPTAGNVPVDVNDVFSTYLYAGNSTANAIENGLALGQSYGSGGVSTERSKKSAMFVNGDADFGYGTGDFTIELWVWINKHKDFTEIWDQRTATQSGTTASPIIYSDSTGTVYFYHSGSNRITSSSGDISEGAWTHIALTRNGGSTKLFVDGTQVGSTYSDSTTYLTPASDWSIGGSLEQSQYNIDGYFSNARVVKGTAVYTSNFTVPTSELTDITNTVLLTAQGTTPFVDNSSSSHTVTANAEAKASTFGPFDAATAGDGGLLWLKNRTTGGSSYEHSFIDSVRGVDQWLTSNSSGAEVGISSWNISFNAAGWSLDVNNSYANDGSSDYVSWAFKQHSKFFTIVEYTGTGSAQNISHDLGSVPGMIITKRTDASENWLTYHRGLDATAPEDKYVMLNKTNAVQDASTIWNDTAPTSTQFTVGSGNTNTSGGTYIAYLFAHHDGDGTFGPDGDQDIIKCGTYSGTGALQEIDLGFEAQWVMLKRIDSTGNWFVFDQMRGLVANPVTGSIPTGDKDAALRANTSAAEQVDTWGIDPSPNGFAVRGNNVSVNGSDYIYVAIRRGPLSVPTVGTDVFFMDVDGNSGDPGFRAIDQVDFSFIRRPDTVESNRASNRLSYSRFIATDSSAAEDSSNSNYLFDYSSGWGAWTSLNSGYQAWMWKRAPKYFDIVTHDGTGGAITLNHNLTIAPEMIWTKSRTDAENWQVWHKDVTGNLELDNSSAANTGSIRVDNVTATSFRLKGFNTGNGSGQTYVSYIFGTAPGVSKVGSFSHTNGTAQDIDCGFTNGARFVLLKRYDSTGSWVVFDTVRGITSGNDPFFKLDDTTVQDSSNDVIEPLAAGFTVASGFLATGNFLFYAIA